MPTQPPPPVPNQSFGKKVVHFVVGLSALAVLGSIGVVVLTVGAKKLGVLPDKGAPTQQRNANSAVGEAKGSGLTAQQSTLLEQARADPDYHTWTEVDELTRDVPDNLDALGALVDRLEPIEGRWSSQVWSKVIADKVDMARRNQTASGRNGYLKLAGEAVSKLRSGIRDRVLHTILTRNLPSLAVSRADMLAFGKEEGMVESWDEGGMIQSEEWRSWTIAPASKQSKRGSQKFPKGSHVGIACDATGAVKSASLSVDLPGDYEYLSGLLALPKPDRDLRHAARVQQILADLPAIVHRFLLVAAPEQADATVQKASELAALNPAQLASGITGATMWLGTLAQGEHRQVEFMLLAGGGLCVIVDQPPVRSRLREIDELTKALGE